MKLHKEQDTLWEPEQCPITKKWSRVKMVSASTWTVYDISPGYQTPVFRGKNEGEADEFIRKTQELTDEA